MKKRLLIFIQAVFFYLLFLLVGYSITGRIDRQHEVLPEEKTILLNNKQITISELASAYQPVIISDIDEPKSINVQYEVSETDKDYIIIYHAEWEDEKHPNFVQDVAWRIFRFAYFGFTTKDSEYIQVNVDKQTGDLVKAVFDTPLENGFSLWVNDLRTTSFLERNDNNVFQLLQEDEVKEENLIIKNNQLELEVGNWNHLFNFTNNIESSKVINFDLEYLSDENYKWYKYARRHHGEVFTPKSPVNTPIIFFASIIFITYLVIILRDYAFSPKEEQEKTKSA